MKFGTNWRPALWSSLAAAVSLLLPGMTLFCINTGEFTFSAGWITGVVALTLLVVVAVLLVPQLLVARWRHHTWLTAMILALAAGLWVQSALLVDLFPDVALSDWDDSWWFYFLSWIFNAAVFVGLVAAAWRWHKWCARNAGKLCLIILAPQLLHFAWTLRHFSAPQYDFAEYSITEKGKFHFGKVRNVIVVVVDCMGEKIFKDTLHKYPELYGTFRDFTCFDRMESPIPRTMFAVPAMLTGVEFQKSAAEIAEEPASPDAHAEYLNRSCRAPDSIFQALRKNGYRCEGYPFVLQTISYSPEVIDNSTMRTNHNESLYQLIDYWALRMMPFFIKPLLSDSWYLITDRFVTPQEDGRVIGGSSEPHDKEFFHQLSLDSQVGAYDKVFKYLHLQGAHQPLVIDDMLQAVPDASPIQQLRGSLSNVELLIRKLQQLGLYDKSLLVVTGDHTERYDSEVVTLIKRPWERHEVMPVNSISCRLSDLAGTVLGELRLAAPGNSLFQRPAVTGSWRSRQTRSGRQVTLNAPRPVPPREFESVGTAGNAFWLEDQVLCLNGGQMAVPENHAVEFYFFRVKDRRAFSTQTGSGFTEVTDYDYLNSYRIPLRDLPDGCYLIYQVIRNQQNANASDVREDVSCLTRYLDVSQGNYTWLRELPNRKFQALTIGEEITFAPMRQYDALVLPPGKAITGNFLRLNKSERLGILLPHHLTEPLALEIEYRAMAQAQGELRLFDGESRLASYALNGSSPQRISVALSPEILNRGRLELGFEVVPRYRNRDARIAQISVQILAFRLVRVAKESM